MCSKTSISTRDFVIESINEILVDFNYPLLTIDENILPNEDDKSTLFMCSGMQRVRHRFLLEKVGKYSSIQKCIRLQDIDLVGDDSHISSFEMIGTFGFNTNDYKTHQQIWHLVLDSLGLKDKISHITYHSEMEEEKWSYWKDLGYTLVQDNEACFWTDGQIGGYCCEVFVGDLEIGNLVNPLGKSCDIGFGLERLVQVLEDKPVNETSLFDLSLSPLARDHSRTLRLLKENGIYPGAKNINSVCKRLIRNLIKNYEYLDEFSDWFDSEQSLLDKKSDFISRNIKKWDTKSPEFWFETHGINQEDLDFWKHQNGTEAN